MDANEAVFGNWRDADIFIEDDLAEENIDFDYQDVQRTEEPSPSTIGGKIHLSMTRNLFAIAKVNPKAKYDFTQ